MSLRQLFAMTSVALVAVLLVIAAPGLSAAQEQDEALAYHAWYAASQGQDSKKAIETAEAYLKSFPQGQYADFLTKWLGPAQLTILNEAIKAGQIDQMIETGDKILATDPENLNVLYALAFQLRNKELLGSPRSYDHADKAKEYTMKAVRLVESGKTLAGVDSFDKNGTLAWLYQVQALVEENAGNEAKAIELFEKSTSLDPNNPQVAGRNLLQVLAKRQADYADTANAYNALPDEARSAAEPSPEVAAVREKLDADADELIDVAAQFVALADTQGLPQGTRDKVYGVLESVYKSRHMEDDAEATGLQAVIDSKK